MIIEKKIVRRDVDQALLDNLSALHPVLARIFAARGIGAQHELENDLEHLLSYRQLSGIEQAVARLYKALQQQQRLMIVGDFDADGATSTALAVSALRALGAKHVHYIVPNRFTYGYGLTAEIVDVANDWKPDVIITVDNGIASCEGVNVANDKGIDVIITDHHLPGDELPAACAIVNPNQPEDTFESKMLAGVGVVFYVMLALRGFLREQQWFSQQQIAEPNMAQFLDLVALGTVADVVPLDRNNRILVHQGISRMRAGHCRPGIKMLAEVANRKLDQLRASDLGFVVAPRLNAAGRLDDMTLGIACLLAEKDSEARTLAQKLDKLNNERKDIESSMQIQAVQAIRQLTLDNKNMPVGITLFDPEWHQGVIGIVAGRIKERMHRPVIAFADTGEGELKGSARSIPGLHLRDSLDSIAKEQPDLIEKFGGHAMAAGLTIKRDNYERFRDSFNKVVSAQLSEKELQGIIHSDGALASDDLTMSMAELLKQAGPWGQSFPEPIFDGVFNVVDQRLLKGKHLKLILSVPDSSKQIDAISFNVDVHRWPNHRCEKVHLAYRLDVNTFQGRHQLQLMIEHLLSLQER